MENYARTCFPLTMMKLIVHSVSVIILSSFFLFLSFLFSVSSDFPPPCLSLSWVPFSFSFLIFLIREFIEKSYHIYQDSLILV
jgi:succinate dehydrogenase/fumarate reductase cytochrome b subunit